MNGLIAFSIFHPARIYDTIDDYYRIHTGNASDRANSARRLAHTIDMERRNSLPDRVIPLPVAKWQCTS